MLKNKCKQLWKGVQRSVSIQITCFLVVSFVLFIVGLMTGFLINKDTIFNALNPQFWHEFITIIGG